MQQSKCLTYFFLTPWLTAAPPEDKNKNTRFHFSTSADCPCHAIKISLKERKKAGAPSVGCTADLESIDRRITHFIVYGSGKVLLFKGHKNHVEDRFKQSVVKPLARDTDHLKKQAPNVNNTQPETLEHFLIERPPFLRKLEQIKNSTKHGHRAPKVNPEQDLSDLTPHRGGPLS